jgi:hypothetical protein
VDSSSNRGLAVRFGVLGEIEQKREDINGYIHVYIEHAACNTHFIADWLL